MSQYRLNKADGMVAYGFDRMLSEYFCTRFDEQMDPVETSGPGMGHVELQEKLQEYGVWESIPEEHRNLIAMDLPI